MAPLNERVEQTTKLLKRLLAAIGHGKNEIEVDPTDDEQSCVSVNSLGVFIDVGWPVERSVEGTLSDPCDGTVRDPGYRVGIYKTHPGNRWNPPETEDVTVLETVSLYEAVEEVGMLIVQDIMRGVAESTYVDEESSGGR